MPPGPGSRSASYWPPWTARRRPTTSSPCRCVRCGTRPRLPTAARHPRTPWPRWRPPRSLRVQGGTSSTWAHPRCCPIPRMSFASTAHPRSAASSSACRYPRPR
ncbi:MAG: hypothetical protein ACK559_03575 [bacterium]